MDSGITRDICLQWPEVIDWLRYVEGTTLGAGWQLIERLVKAGKSDGPAWADRILGDLEKIGFIQRGKYEPSPSQIFFGVGGRRPGRNHNLAHTYPQEYNWTPLPPLTEFLREHDRRRSEQGPRPV